MASGTWIIGEDEDLVAPTLANMAPQLNSHGLVTIAILQRERTKEDRSLLCCGVFEEQYDEEERPEPSYLGEVRG